MAPPDKPAVDGHGLHTAQHADLERLIKEEKSRVDELVQFVAQSTSHVNAVESAVKQSHIVMGSKQRYTTSKER